MSCFYCGKRVSLVRKRTDADFCCADHRERYHARTLRTIETLREADEQLAVTRRLNESLPLAPTVPCAAGIRPRCCRRTPDRRNCSGGWLGATRLSSDSRDSRSYGKSLCLPEHAAQRCDATAGRREPGMEYRVRAGRPCSLFGGLGC